MIKLEKAVPAVLFVVLFMFATAASAMKDMNHSGHDMSDEKMDHSSMAQDGAKSGHFKHADMADGIHTTFQIMSLASMKMKDPEGKTHHIMVSFSQNNQRMKAVVGDIKVVSPSGKDQVGELKHFGGGMYAVNFTFDEVGEWHVSCHFRVQASEHTIKFAYPHDQM
ncbi:hypothetical protein [Desulfogranum marinum]|uniref:hypothetical protein n=1 Tax=Desulfogranum marinum TaxID=453220 RepID=UPI0019637FDF|nr:hypothetical protein [Desulfogranum marinum]MBM9514971.1 hypothetical protein [Desulfogranum marinum]